MSTPTVVIKYGGHAMEQPELAAAFAGGLTRLSGLGMRLVIVHGGGPYINLLLRRLNIESCFADGLRITDAATMEAVEMALCGQVNKALISRFTRCGIMAAGISGKDAQLLRAKRIAPKYGLVGEVESVNPRILELLLAENILPVVAPVGCGEQGESLNINADTAAGAIAGALRADYFILVSDVPGVVDKEGSLLPGLTRESIRELLKDGVICGGMIPKVEACLHALDSGCSSALILDGRAPAALERCLLENARPGTLVTREQVGVPA